jgi:hypothetical protein
VQKISIIYRKTSILDLCGFEIDAKDLAALANLKKGEGAAKNSKGPTKDA